MIWSKFTRIIHWGLAATIVANLFFTDEGEQVHQVIGYAATGIVLVRIVFGFVAKGVSSFKYFPLHEFFAFSRLEFLAILGKAKPKDFIGHNPAASVVYLLIWAAVIALGISGYLMSTDRFWGEEWLENLHELFANGVQILVLIHLMGILLDSWLHKRKTWLGMITGKRS